MTSTPEPQATPLDRFAVELVLKGFCIVTKSEDTIVYTPNTDTPCIVHIATLEDSGFIRRESAFTASHEANAV